MRSCELSRRFGIGPVVVALGLLAAPATAQQAPTRPDVTDVRLDATGAATADEQAAPEQLAPPPHITVTTGMDAASSYMFRGLYQEDRGVVAPAFVDVRIPLAPAHGRVPALRANVGMWNSFHSGPTGAQGYANAWYEADYYASLTASFGRWSPGVVALVMTSPNTAFNTVYEFNATLEYDDHDSVLPLAPRLFFAAEVAGQMDAGEVPGRYIEASIRPSRALGASGPMAFSVAMPVKSGTSIRGFYESGQSGVPYFASAGLVPAMTVAGPRVSLDLHGGLELMRLGGPPAGFNRGDRFKAIVTIGASITY